jgi:hypothetical protein
MPNFPQEIASFPFYATFYQILMAGVNANQAAQLSYIRNLQLIAFRNQEAPATAPTDKTKPATVFNLKGPLNYVEFDSELDIEEPSANPPPPFTTRTVKKYVKVPLLAVVDVRPMAIDKITADLSIKLKSEVVKKDESQFKFDQAIDVALDLGFLSVKSHTEISYQQSSSLTQGTTREYNLEVHMEASTQPLNAPLKNIIDYLIRQEPA